MLLASAIGGGFFVTVITAASGSQAAGSPSGNVTTATGPTFSIVGGSGTLSYNNTIVTPDGTYGTPTVTNAASLTPAFNDTINALETSISTWRLTVTDARGFTATADYTVTLNNTSV